MDMDAEFAALMGEVSKIPSQVKAPPKRDKDGKVIQQVEVGVNLGTANEQVERLIAKTFTNGFDVLMLPPEAGEDDIRKQYRKMSLMVHPDKCKHERAQDAFQVVTKAYEELQKPENRTKYQKVIAEARKRVEKQREKENKRREAAKEPLLDASTMNEDVMAECEKMLKEMTEREEYARKVREKNEQREKQQEEKLQQDELKKCEEKRKWIEERDGRVNDWRQFQSATKKTKVDAFKPVHKKETREVKGDQKKPAGIDESYKANWR